MNIFFNPEIEKNLLSCAINDKMSAIKLLTELNEDDFCDSLNKCVFIAIDSIFRRNLPVENVLISAELESMKIQGARKYLDSIQSFDFSIDTVKGLTEKIKEMSKRRKIYKYVQEIKKACENEAEFDKIMNIMQNPPVIESENAKIYSNSELISDAKRRLLQRRNDSNKIHGITTGFRDLDILTGGLNKKEMTVLGARPSIGKSLLALDISRNAAKKGFTIAYFSLEMGKEQLIDREISQELLIENDKIKYPQLLIDSELEKLENSNINTELSGLYTIEQPDITLSGIRAKCLEIMLIHGKLDLIIIDYLQYMAGNGINKREVVENNSKGLKQLAKDLNIHVLCISSLNRVSETTSDKRPSMADLRESGQIEYDADNIILMHRDRLGKESDKSHTELLVEKQRNGKTGVIFLQFIEKYITFKDSERR